MGKIRPLARTTDLVTEELDDELLVYDEQRDVACSLNRSAALVWRHSNGKRTVADLVRNVLIIGLMIVVGYVIKGKWRYLEHEWIADEGSFVYEPPGEVHTLVVPDDCHEMITFFNISGAMIYLDNAGQQIGYEDVFSKIEMCRRHYGDVGLGAEYVDQFIR